MNNVTAVQIHCPFCNGAQAVQHEGNYICEFCLQPFSIVQAQKEESRILEEIKGWLEKKVGAAGLAPGSVDASSRAYIFGQKILPDLRRDVDRALESLGMYGQFPLVPLPIAMPRPPGLGPNPLVQARQEILSLKNLRARLASDQVTSFTVGEADRASIQKMDWQLADVVYLSNVADAATRKDVAGYATARRNLTTLIKEIGQSIAQDGISDGSLTAFLTGLKSRYQGLAEVCSICEDLSGQSEIAGEPLADRLDSIQQGLLSAAEVIERSDYSPADSMPVVVGVRQEAAAVSLLARWLRAYEVLARKGGLSFTRYVAEVNALYDDSKYSAEAKTDMVEGCAFLIRAVRAEVSLPVHDDFDWVDVWLEGSRTKKSFGMFGVEERIVESERFLLPVWIADISFSRSSGKVFKEGVEAKCIAIVDACGPTTSKVHFLSSESNILMSVLAMKKRLSSRIVALPTSTAATARTAFEQAARSRPDLQNPRVEVRGIAFISAAVATLDSKKGKRELVGCLDGQVPVDPSVRIQVAAAKRALGTFT